MYKDRDKQREANRQAAKEYREKRRNAIEGMTTAPKNVIPVIPKRGKGQPYQMTVMERLFYRPAHLLKPGETNFVSLPGRACYGQA